MWDPQRLTTLWASTACYRDSSTFCFLRNFEVNIRRFLALLIQQTKLRRTDSTEIHSVQ
jgi:hypothetical protein